MIVDAHMHIWNRLHGRIGGKTPLVGAGNGTIRIGDRLLLGMPASHTDSLAHASQAVAEFDAAGVDVGVVVQEYMDGEQNDYCRQALAHFPGRFFCHGLPNFFDTASVARECEQLFAAGFRGIKMPAGHLAAAEVPLDQPEFNAIWDQMQSAGFVLAIDFSEGVAQVPAMRNILRQFPQLKVAIGHFGMPTRQGWPQQLELCNHEQVYIETGGIIWLYRHEGYPFPGALAAIQQAAKTVGWEKLMWGSDWPRTMVDFTYRQSLDFVRRSDEIKENEKALLLGQNAARLYRLTPPATQRSPLPLITEG